MFGLSVKVSVLRSGEKVHFSARSGRDREVLVDLRQALEDVVVRDLADRRRRRAGRIEPRRLEHHADRHAVLGEGKACRRHEGKNKRDEKSVGRGAWNAPRLARSLSIAPQDARASSASPSSRSGEKGPKRNCSEKGPRRSVRARSPPAGRARRSAMNRSNSSRSLARRIASTYSANSRCASSSLRRSSSSRASSAVRHSLKAALPVEAP